MNIRKAKTNLANFIWYGGITAVIVIILRVLYSLGEIVYAPYDYLESNPGNEATVIWAYIVLYFVELGLLITIGQWAYTNKGKLK